MAADPNEPSRRVVIGTVAGGALALVAGIGTDPAAAAAPPRVRKIMIIRHAEKPAEDGSPPPGIGADGDHDRHALLVRGWQRAGALVRFFAPRDGHFSESALATPTAIIPAVPTSDHKSERSMLTVGPLAAVLGLAIATHLDSDDIAGAVFAALAHDGPVLLAWEHKRIGDLVAGVTGGTIVPPHWPGHRYDVVLVLDRDQAGWRLTQVPQLLLAGDSDKMLTPSAAGDAPDPD